jgi:hypothetical protein
MRNFTFVFLTLIAGCSNEANHLGNPLLLPLNALGSSIGNAVYSERRGKVEVFVKTNHPALIADIQRGGGPTLTQAFDIADVHKPVRAPHTLQLQSDLALYSNNLEALIVAIMVVSG